MDVEPEALARHAQVLDAIDALRVAAGDGAVDPHGLPPAEYAPAIETLVAASTRVGYLGLRDFSLMVQAVFEARREDLEGGDVELWSEFRQWPGLLYGFLDSPHTEHARRGLVGWLAQPSLQCGMGRDESDILYALLPQGIPKSVVGATGGTSSASTFGDSWPSLDDATLAGMDGSAGIGSSSTVAETMAANDAAVSDATNASATATGATTDFVVELADSLPPMSDATREIISLLHEELAELHGELIAGTGEQGPTRESLLAHADNLERYGGACEAAGYTGLAQMLELVRLALLDDGADPGTLHPAMVRLGESMLAYVAEPRVDLHREALLQTFCELDGTAWPATLEPADVDAMRDALARHTLEDGLEQPSRAATASDEDVSLALPEDVNPDLLDAMLQELPEQTEELSGAVQRMLGGDATLDDVDVAQRIAHTVKGAGNTVGVIGIARLTHTMEDLLLACKKHGRLPGAALADSLMSASDCLEAMCESVAEGTPGPTESLAVFQSLLDWANLVDRDGADALGASPETSSVAAAAEATAAETMVDGPEEVLPPAAAPATMEPAAMEPTAEKPAAKPAAPADEAETQMVRVPAALLDSLLRLVGESIILTGQVQERMLGNGQRTRDMLGQFDMLRGLSSELEQQIDVRDLAGNADRGGDAAFDPLEMEQYNELHTTGRRLAEAATDAREIGLGISAEFEQLDEMLIAHSRLNREVEDAVLRTRMVPVTTVLPRLQRAVRQAARLTSKSVSLDVSGGNTPVDSHVLSDLVAPVMHLLRNAVDHGVETAEERVSKGKPAEGSVHLAFDREGNQVVVRCTDDGRGLDYSAIAQRARDEGLLGPGEDADEEALKRYLLRPNFTTRSQVTQVSGRGVGLNAVHIEALRLGGTLTLESREGEGLSVEMRLPLTLISTHALMIAVGSRQFAIANRGIEQIVHPQVGRFTMDAGRQQFVMGDDSFEVRPIETLLDLRHRTGDTPLEVRPLMLVRGELGVVAVPVEKVVGSRDLVVKNLGRYLPRVAGVLGATVLGDGSVTPVLDLSELLHESSSYRNVLADVGESTMAGAEEGEDAPHVLVVDDSLSARRALVQALEDEGYNVASARDGMEATARLEERVPLAVVTDLEMPRMNGMELTRHVRSRDALRDVPVVMVTSRSTAKHQAQAQQAGVNVYLTKPFNVDLLLEHMQSFRAAAGANDAWQLSI